MNGDPYNFLLYVQIWVRCSVDFTFSFLLYYGADVLDFF